MESVSRNYTRITLQRGMGGACLQSCAALWDIRCCIGKGLSQAQDTFLPPRGYWAKINAGHSPKKKFRFLSPGSLKITPYL